MEKDGKQVSVRFESDDTSTSEVKKLQIVSPIVSTLSESETRTLSWCDTRRIASKRAKERLKERRMQIEFDLQKGKLRNNEGQKSRFLAQVSDKELESVIKSWSYIVKFSKRESVRLLAAYAKLSPLYSRHLTRWTETRCVACRRRQVCNEKHLQQLGCDLIDNIMKLLVNIRNEPVTVYLVNSFYERLLKFGHTIVSMKACKVSFLSYLQDTLANQWSNELWSSWNKIIEGIIKIGQMHMASLVATNKEELQAEERARKNLLTLNFGKPA